MTIDDYFFIKVDVPTQVEKDLANHAATIMDSDSYWLTHDYPDKAWRKGNSGSVWFMGVPAGTSTQAVVNAWLDPAKDYNSPEFLFFLSGS